MNKIMAIMITVLSGITAALSTLPYGWAHVAATACAAGMGAMGLSAGAYSMGATRITPQAVPFWPVTPSDPAKQ
jgi:hypothetical protein